jgi:hemolysin activation/secretion protein
MIFILIVLFLLSPVAAHAASPPLERLIPDQIERQIENRPAPDPVAPSVAGTATAADSELAEQSFVLAGVLIEGATVYPALDFLPYYQVDLGTRVTVSTLRGIAEAITRHYQNDGYFLSSAFLPAQDIQYGIVRIRVLEGYLAGWSSPGSVSPPDPLITQWLEPVMRQRPVRKELLTAAVIKIGTLPGLSVRPQVRAVTGQAGAYELLLPLERRHLDGSLNIDNRGSEFIGPIQGILALRAYNLTRHHESYQLRLATAAHTSELTYIDAATEWLLPYDGLRLQASVTRVGSDPGGSLELRDAHIENSRYRFGLSYRLLRTSIAERTLGVYLNRYHSRTDLDGAKRLEDKLTGLNLNYRHGWIDERGATHSLTASISRGLALGDTSVIDTDLGMGVGTPGYTKMNLGYGGRYRLGRQWNLSAQLDGQYARNELPSSERYSIGGPLFGRAYDPSELTGDHALAGRMELADRDGPVWRSWRFAPYAFYDLGAVWQHGCEDKDARASAASAGLGARVHVSALSLTAELAKPLTRPVSAEGAEGDEARIFGGLNYRF